MAAFVVYDLLDENSLFAAVEWKKRINNSVCMKSGDPIPVYLIGNKVGYFVITHFTAYMYLVLWI